jgi:adenosylmethionine-8-amino-7-oxononanoate aminotransferase
MRSPFLHPFAKPAADAAAFTTIVRGDGALVWDDGGREYVDAMAGLWYCNIGHGRTEVADAVRAQMGELATFHTFDRFTNRPVEALAARLRELAPFPEARTFLTTSGSEAVETAIKLARLTHWLAGERERTLVISRAPSYHGVTTGALAVTGIPLNQEGYGPLLGGVIQVPAHDLDAMARTFAEHPGEVAAVLAEPVIGAGGVLPPEPGELEGLRRLCDDHGALLVLDEVISGFGRLGRWFGAERFGVRPDLVTFAKAVTSGYLPLGGVLVSRRVLDALESDPDLMLRHGHTYSGHPTACVAALTALAITEREGLLEQALKVGDRLSRGLRQLPVAEVRGDGAVWAVGLPEGTAALDVRERMMTAGVIARPLGTSTIAFCPPLVITDDQIDRCVDALAGAL